MTIEQYLELIFKDVKLLIITLGIFVISVIFKILVRKKAGEKLNLLINFFPILLGVLTSFVEMLIVKNYDVGLMFANGLTYGTLSSVFYVIIERVFINKMIIPKNTEIRYFHVYAMLDGYVDSQEREQATKDILILSENENAFENIFTFLKEKTQKPDKECQLLTKLILTHCLKN